MHTFLRHSLKLALVTALFAATSFAAPQSQDPPPPTPPAQDPSQTQTPPPAQQPQTQQPAANPQGPTPVPQQDTVHPKNSKDDVEAIGNRNVGKGINLYSLEREIALGKALAQDVERSSKMI